MKTSQYLLSTLREAPTEAEVISHQLLLRGGFMRKSASGIYSWLPLGLRVVRRVEAIVREEMNRVGALEFLLPMVQPADLWQASGRWEKYGAELLRFQDRHDRDFCLGPTHEEVIVDIVSREIRSYKQLPANYYQIQTKFRDEIRPRFGVMRGREFIMKDAYSFHIDRDCLADTYEAMKNAYCAIFERLGLAYRVVQADNGSIGGDSSHEFHILAESGEDAIVFDTHSDYTANMEKAVPAISTTMPPAPISAPVKVETPNSKTISALCEELGIHPTETLKAIVVKGTETEAVAIFVRGDHHLNETKAAHHPLIADPLTFVEETELPRLIGCHAGSIGPMGLVKRGVPVLVDNDASVIGNFVSGANEDGYHYTHLNWKLDDSAADYCLVFTEVAQLREVVVGDPSPVSDGTLQVKRGIEIGHIFQLGDIYAKAMKASVLNEQGKSITLQMGCYGIGVTRIVAAAIEQKNDDNGIIWTNAMAPFAVALIPMQYHKFPRVAETADALYKTMQGAGIEVLFDDRKERSGIMFNDMDLIGIPLHVIVGERNLDKQQVEVKFRESGDTELINISDLIPYLQSH